MNLQHLERIIIRFAAALILFSPRVWAGVDVSGVTARPAPDWLGNGTVYEIFPRDFSVDGNLGVNMRQKLIKNCKALA